RAHVYSIFATLAIGLDVLAEEGVGLEFLNAHGGLFRTAGVAQRFLAAATGTPTAVAESAGEGGAWGIALLAAYHDHSETPLSSRSPHSARPPVGRPPIAHRMTSLTSDRRIRALIIETQDRVT